MNKEKKQKYLRITMSDGSKWDVPTILIAKHRANYYSGVDPKTSFDEEVKFALEDEYATEEWAANNMNWKDVVLQAQKVIEPEVDYQEGWVNGKKEIIEK